MENGVKYKMSLKMQIFLEIYPATKGIPGSAIIKIAATKHVETVLKKSV
ncbi:hypothetical protein HZF24_06460 [Sedimentibacter hydroxybenzoicus DSM 7310]|uniref:Uncharacterized protein n=1 Tax=Sedimentibacter hydroxybenzoicus DSM 7310 TaxID=1123245 RepID=A0A974BIK5_SEDHY|nr:hypothetical protein [Sedimentibacter hydroxybenzoicus]NYB73782.1 hypothetical protein [Sedimentibacter hydroxybenzoicus DSM 7310]